MFCTSCGQPVEDGARFCGSCGAAIGAPPQAPTPQVPQVEPQVEPQPQSSPPPPPQEPPYAQTIGGPSVPPVPNEYAHPAPGAPMAPPSYPGDSGGYSPPPMGVGHPTDPTPNEGGGPNKALIAAVAGLAILLLGAAWFVFGRDSGDELRVDPTGIQLQRGDGPSGAPEEAWSKEVGCSSEGCITVIEDGLFFNDGDEEVVRYSADSGEEEWRVEVEDLQMIEVVDGALLAHGYGDASVRRLSVSNGETEWTTDADISTSFNVEDYDLDGMVLVPGQYGTIALNLENGEEEWSTGGEPMAVCEGIVVIRDDEELRAIDGSDGEELWSNDSEGSASCGNGVLLMATSELVVLDLKDGEELWDLDVSPWGAFGYQNSVIVQDGGDLVAVKVSDGEEIWRQDHDLQSGFGVQGETVFGDVGWGFSDPDLFSFNLKTGEKIETAEIFDDGEDGVILLNGQVVLFDDDEMKSLDVRTFEENWSSEMEIEGDNGFVSGFAVGKTLFVLDGFELRAFK